MAGFILKNTLSDNGSVTRGVCQVGEDGYLTDVVETHDIEKTADGAQANGVKIDVESLVSMNMWGLSTEYMNMLSEIEKIPGVKKVFVRSGIRFDYLIYDQNDSFFRRLVTNHVSGQLKVAPEHCSDNALSMMGKPFAPVFERFKKKYFALCSEAGLEQYLVPYLMSSHPGTTMKDAVEMALWLKKWGYSPEQVQDFYPTPGTISTVMYYTGINPMNGKRVAVTTDYHEKQLQRALLQYSRPENANLVREALRLAGREDLIGNGPECLVRHAFGQGRQTRVRLDERDKKSARNSLRGKGERRPKASGSVKATKKSQAPRSAKHSFAQKGTKLNKKHK